MPSLVPSLTPVEEGRFPETPRGPLRGFRLSRTKLGLFPSDPMTWVSSLRTPDPDSELRCPRGTSMTSKRSDGVLECWSIGLFQHSITPLLQNSASPIFHGIRMSEPTVCSAYRRLPYPSVAYRSLPSGLA